MPWKETSLEHLAKSLGLSEAEVREKQRLIAMITEIRKKKGISQEALAKCRQRGLQSLIRGSVTHIPFPDRSLDCILSLDVLYHSGVDDDEGALREFHRVLRTSGKLILNLPAYEWLRSAHDYAIHTRRRYTRKIVKAKLSAAGFVSEKISYRNCFLLPLVWIWRIFRRSSITSNAGSDLFEVSQPLNRILLQLLRIESRMMDRIDLPFGSSVFCIARKL